MAKKTSRKSAGKKPATVKRVPRDSQPKRETTGNEIDKLIAAILKIAHGSLTRDLSTKAIITESDVFGVRCESNWFCDQVNESLLNLSAIAESTDIAVKVAEVLLDVEDAAATAWFLCQDLGERNYKNDEEFDEFFESPADPQQIQIAGHIRAVLLQARDKYREQLIALIPKLKALKFVTSLAGSSGKNTESQRGAEFTQVFTRKQVAILEALNGKGLTKDELAASLNLDDPRGLYNAGGLKDLTDRGVVINRLGIGYFRPDAPPPNPLAKSCGTESH